MKLTKEKLGNFKLICLYFSFGGQIKSCSGLASVCSGITLGGLWGYGVPGIQPGYAACKASSQLSILSLQPSYLYFKLGQIYFKVTGWKNGTILCF